MSSVQQRNICPYKCHIMCRISENVRLYHQNMSKDMKVPLLIGLTHIHSSAIDSVSLLSGCTGAPLQRCQWTIKHTHPPLSVYTLACSTFLTSARKIQSYTKPLSSESHRDTPAAIAPKESTTWSPLQIQRATRATASQSRLPRSGKPR